MTAVKPGIDITLYLATEFRRRRGNLHEFTNIYVTLHLKRGEKNFVDRSRHKCYVDSHSKVTFPSMSN